ncbi:Flagellar basal-body rod protein FlgC [Lacunisphaera limnophila]|uniref:Flagellar basal-body rod protein FlgC n=1 Tax=Lacunisphaera limnophila TaxID=1838286 RepID=A0A1D8AW70_9BACT|nr:flagellar basal body rod protein FlgC [Lacunisphaera limnophila]AOS45105.1 Flagellar basal-body rod protein FlgC [Lacunisphaera limnophila]
MNLIAGVDITAGALNAQKLRLDLVAQNIANAHTTRTPEGGPYRRKIISFESELVKRAGGASLTSVSVSGITSDKSPGQSVYNPQHPDAGPDGSVMMPNVNLAFEMVDLITATRAYEANLSVVKNARNLAMKVFQIGK